MKKIITLSAIAFSLIGTTYGQFITEYEYLSMNPAVGIGIGSTNYFGELNRIEEFSAAKTSTFGANAFYTHPISPSVYAKANVMYNRISHWGIDSSDVHNFSTRMYGLDLGAFYRLDNDIVFDQQKSLTVFAGGGFGMGGFSAKEDLMNENSANYHYWTDGTIRDLAENDPQSEDAVKIARDYNYETDIETEKSFFPYLYLEAGFGLKITHNLTANISYKHSFTFTDEIDGVTSDSRKDRFDYINVSLGWNFGTPYRTADEIMRDKEAETIDFSDMDEDGILDNLDACAKTPLGWEVDNKGCPLDSDGDKVPDAIDKELDTKKDAIVDETGRTLTDEEIEVLYLLQTNQIGIHEKFKEWKVKYPELFEKYYGESSTSKSSSSSEEE